MTARPPHSTRSVLDGMLLAGAFLHLATLLVFGHVVRVDAGAADFAERFAAISRLARNLAVPLGVCTSVLLLVALVREAGGGRRRNLRVLALALFFSTGVIGYTALEPLERPILAAPATERPGLLDRLGRWQRLIEVVSGVAGLVLVLAHRAPRQPAVEVPGGLTARHRKVLLLLGTASLFEGYDRFIVTLALPDIARDLHADESALGFALAAIRIGALLAIGLGNAADRFGRRRMLLVTVLGYTLATGATAFSRGLVDFVCLQLLAIAFLSSELSLAQVVIAEEFPARARGFGQGLLGAAGALGAGLAALLFPILAATAFGWRGLYLVGILPLLLIGYLRRSLPETSRWQHLAGRDRPATAVLAVLAPAHRRSFAVLVAVTAFATAAAASAFGFASYRARTTFGWTPAQVSGMVIAGGGLGFWGWMVFGRLADVVGRRVTGSVALAGGSFAIATYFGTEWLFAGFTALVFFEAGVTIAINALSTELFPTSLRATAKSWVTIAAVFGAMLGLGTVGGLAERVGGHAAVITTLGLLPVFLAPLLFLLPETHGRELEATSGEA